MENGIFCLLVLVVFYGDYLTVNGQDECPVGKYGGACEYTCHCAGGVACLKDTGQCPESCAPGWSGAPYCQAENIAPGKKTYQHGTYLGWNSSRAVDGNDDQDGTYGSCSWAHNNDDVFKTWWNVDLQTFRHVHSVQVYFRTDDGRSQSRRAGVRVYVSASAEQARNEGLCYMDQLNDFIFPPPHLVLTRDNMTCTQRKGRFVILYVDRPVRDPQTNCPVTNVYSCWANLELCEVEVYACTNGTYGDQCEKRCNCQGNVACDSETGVCPVECQKGWQGISCNQECSPGQYGENCNTTCGHCRDQVKSCDRFNGTCPACLAGWQGDKCTEVCDAGYYGLDCAKPCGNCLGVCDAETGVCSQGCQPGWVGATCLQACAPGFYGENCETPCANCASDATCDHVTGNCPVGCQAGFSGIRCDQDCPTGLFGPACAETCGRCEKNMVCDHVTGLCPMGCQAGWQGDSCKQKCTDKSYGSQCQGQCGICENDEPCDHVTGYCPKGCADGWIGDKCKNRCLPGHYGKNCSDDCSKCLKDAPCDHVTGKCKDGCDPGWEGEKCQNACARGTHGEACRETCGHCKNDTLCNHIDGHCPRGCQTNYYGPQCTLYLSQPDEEGEEGVDSSLEEDNTGLSIIIGGVMAGVFIAFLGILMLVLVRRRRKPQGRRSDHQQQQQQPPTPTQQADRRNNRANSYTNVEVVHHNGDANLLANHVTNNLPARSPTPSRASSHATNITSVTAASQSHLSIDHDDQEVLYVNVKKSPIPLPVQVPSPMLSTFQHDRNQANGSSGENVYYNTKLEQALNESGVPVEHFQKYVRGKEATHNSFKKEFSQYPHGIKYPTEAGRRPRNKFKNRFAQMFPYDHSRIVLHPDETEPDSDYINANFVDSVDYPKCYVASQGPNKITLKDFWRMIWQSNTGKIVMLTNLVEETKNKCEKYWPDEGKLTFGDLQIEMRQQQEHPFYTIRLLQLTHQQVPHDIRTIKQFHFTAWPDHGVPDTFEIVSFFKCVIRTPISLPGPMIIHCSAGVGRTGTFIALDALYHHGKRGNNIDIPKFIHKMRQQRMNMIQTLDQYKLLHYALVEALENDDTTISRTLLQTQGMKFIKQFQAGHQPNRIHDEFVKLEDLKPKHGNENYIAALRKDNVEKNRTLNVLAADRYRPYLSTYIHDTTDYINAVAMPSRCHSIGYIVTQLPLKNTIADFWRLLYDHSSNVVVSLNALDEDQEDACAWWPSEGESVNFGPLQVDTLSVEAQHDEVTERSFRITRKGVRASRLIRMLTYNYWYPASDIPVSIDSFLDLHRQVTSLRKSLGEHHPVTVLCLDGVTCCAVYVAISNVLDQLQTDNEVDIFNNVRQIQMRRPQAIKNKEQYFFIYNAIAQFVEMSSLYKNM